MLLLSVPRLLATSGNTIVKTLVPIMALSAEGYISLLTILEVTEGTIYYIINCINDITFHLVKKNVDLYPSFIFFDNVLHLHKTV